MLKLQQLKSFNFGLFLVYWYIHYLVERGGTLSYDRFDGMFKVTEIGKIEKKNEIICQEKFLSGIN